jgi:hypothetical protein
MAPDEERKPQHAGDREGQDGWDEGQPTARSYGEGVTDAGPESEEDLGAGRGAWGQQGWGQYTEESAHGSDLGTARNRHGNTRDDQYGPGRFTRRADQLAGDVGAPDQTADADGAPPADHMAREAGVRDVQRDPRAPEERDTSRSPESTDRR